jgi:beta-glucuronidase
MEPVPAVSLRRPRITPNVAGNSFQVVLPITNNKPGYRVRAVLSDKSGVVTEAETSAEFDLAPALTLSVPSARRRLWSIDDPFLYDLEVAIVDAAGNVIDTATSYAGLRSVAIDGTKVKINGKVVFQRLVLDQGYYIDGVMTAPTDKALEDDILMSMAAGFNGARLHQKVFEERFLYHADRLGYIVWGEFGDWGVAGYGPHTDHQKHSGTFITQWLEALERDFNHPSIIGWCPLNETHQVVSDNIMGLDDITTGMYLATKGYDPSRPVLDTSGYSHRVRNADIYDSHDYIGESDYAEGLQNFIKRQQDTSAGKPFVNAGDKGAVISVPYAGQPYFVSEFGGFKWNPNDTSSWGYGSSPETIEEFYKRFEDVCNVLLDQPDQFGYCYTQLTDIYPEENGIYTFARESKFDLDKLKAIQSRPAAIELRED